MVKLGVILSNYTNRSRNLICPVVQLTYRVQTVPTHEIYPNVTQNRHISALDLIPQFGHVRILIGGNILELSP